MNCDETIHVAFKDMQELICPFCHQQLAEIDNNIKAIEFCCSDKELKIVVDSYVSNVVKSTGFILIMSI